MNGPEQRLDTQSVTAIAGAVNSELKVTLYNFTPECDSSEWIRAQEIHEEIRSGGGFEVADEIDYFAIRLMMQRAAAKDFVRATPDDRFQRSEAGEIAYGFGGQLLDIGLRHNVPIRTLVGENSQAQLADGSVRDAVESRLLVLYDLFRRPKDRWTRLKKIIDDIEPYGLQERSVRNALVRLEEARVAERRLTPDPQRDGRKTVEMRLRTVNGTDYRSAIGEYMSCVGELALMNVDMLRDGQRKAREVIARAIDNNTLSMLLKRAQASDSHFGMTRVKAESNGNTNSNGHTDPVTLQPPFKVARINL